MPEMLPRFVAEVRPAGSRQGTFMISGEFNSYRLEQLKETVRSGVAVIKLSLLCDRDHQASRMARAWISDISSSGVDVEFITL
jgi:hypothetical protein